MKSSQNHLWFVVIWTSIVVPMAMGSLFAQDYINAQLPWHRAVLDSQGRLLAWYHPEKNLGYDKFLRLDWDFLEHKVPKEGNTGLKVYLVNSIYDPETLQGIKSELDIQHNPAGAYAHFVDMLMGWYPYSGDEEAIRVVWEMLDYQLAHGTTLGIGTGRAFLSQPPVMMTLSTVGASATCLRISTVESRLTRSVN